MIFKKDNKMETFTVELILINKNQTGVLGIKDKLRDQCMGVTADSTKLKYRSAKTLSYLCFLILF